MDKINNIQRSKRKVEHIQLALEKHGTSTNFFDDINLVYQALGNINLQDINIAKDFLGYKCSAPIMINAITGGAKELVKVNESLAKVAKQTNIPMAVGSQMAGVIDSDLEYSFKVAREVNPDGIIIANIGANGRPEQAIKAVDMIKAQALQIHINMAQETLMPEGEHNFSDWQQNIIDIIQQIHVPVIVKEVGFGISMEVARLLRDIGVHHIDVGGFGGTDFAAIEATRSGRHIAHLKDIGIPTPLSVLEVRQIINHGELIASGGIFSSLEAVKSLALGATMVGVAGGFLQVLLKHGEQALIDEIELWKQEIREICLLVGVKHIEQLNDIPVMVTGKIGERANLRGLIQN